MTRFCKYLRPFATQTAYVDIIAKTRTKLYEENAIFTLGQQLLQTSGRAGDMGRDAARANGYRRETSARRMRETASTYQRADVAMT